jgi:hypothetical protein
LRTSQALCAVPLAGDQGAARSGARPRAASAVRAACERRERIPTRARACVRPADRRRSGLGSCRTRQLAHARLGGRSRTDAIRDRSGRCRSDVRHVLFRSGLRYPSALYLHHRSSRTATAGRCRRSRFPALHHELAATSLAARAATAGGRIVARGQPAALSTARILGWPSISSSSTTSTSSRPTMRVSRRRPSGEKPQ